MAKNRYNNPPKLEPSFKEKSDFAHVWELNDQKWVRCTQFWSPLCRIIGYMEILELQESFVAIIGIHFTQGRTATTRYEVVQQKLMQPIGLTIWPPTRIRKRSIQLVKMNMYQIYTSGQQSYTPVSVASLTYPSSSQEHQPRHDNKILRAWLCGRFIEIRDTGALAQT